jgi:hypothetical protein
MREQPIAALRPAQVWLGQFAQRVGWRPDDVPLGPVEDAVQVALHPVEPSADFRQSLHSNLAMAAQHRMAGLVIEYPHPFRESLILGISAGLLAATLAVLLLVLRSRSTKKGRQAAA